MIFDPFLTPIKLNTGGRKVKTHKYKRARSPLSALMDAEALLTQFFTMLHHTALLLIAIMLAVISVLL